MAIMRPDNISIIGVTGFDEDGNTIEDALFKDYLPAQLQKVETALQL